VAILMRWLIRLLLLRILLRRVAPFIWRNVSGAPRARIKGFYAFRYPSVALLCAHEKPTSCASQGIDVAGDGTLVSRATLHPAAGATSRTRSWCGV